MRETWANAMRSLIDSSGRRWKRLSNALQTVRPQAAAVLRWIAEPVTVVAVTLVSTTAFAQPFYVPSGSMEPTIAIGDALIATKFPYGYSSYSIPFNMTTPSSHRLFGSLPARGDIAVFRLPRDPGVNYVKRVIGLPGDRVQMKDGRLWINGIELPLRAAGQGNVEDSSGNIAAVPRYIETLPGGREHPIYKWRWSGELDNTQVFVVPKDHLFMMGDNRDDSTDSRVAEKDNGVGFVPVANLVGRAEFVIGSYDFLNAEPISGWFSAVRLSRFFRGVD
ncbi:MAG: signal peptidase I [Rhizomicrobium sp.]|jgi:signal peptidase I